MSKKENSVYRRLKESIEFIKEDYNRESGLSFLSRKYFAARPTMKNFLIKEGIYKDKK